LPLGYPKGIVTTNQLLLTINGASNMNLDTYKAYQARIAAWNVYTHASPDDRDDARIALAHATKAERAAWITLERESDDAGTVR